jgi:hypothetical protein
MIFLVVLCFCGRLLSQDVIVWDSAARLSWGDFLGKADPKSPWNAATVSGIVYKLNLNGQGLTDSVTAVFYKSDSWVKDSTADGLIHEQGHFDITEIFARKLRKRIQEFVPKRGDLAHQLMLLYDEIESERKAMENLYDRETGHSADAVRQAEWNVRIRNALKGLEKFAD